jgi:hypothetical protein
VKKIRELGKQDVQFAAFPETVVPYCLYFSFVQPAFAMGKEHQHLLEQSVTVPSAETQAIGEAAKDPGVYAKKFSGRYEHRLITCGIGHNLPQEAPQAFAQAVIDIAAES